MAGHALAASSAIEAAACLIALQQQAIPPTINLENLDPACDLNHVANITVEKNLNEWYLIHLDLVAAIVASCLESIRPANEWQAL